MLLSSRHISPLHVQGRAVDWSFLLAHCPVTLACAFYLRLCNGPTWFRSCQVPAPHLPRLQVHPPAKFFHSRCQATPRLLLKRGIFRRCGSVRVTTHSAGIVTWYLCRGISFSWFQYDQLCSASVAELLAFSALHASARVALSCSSEALQEQTCAPFRPACHSPIPQTQRRSTSLFSIKQSQAQLDDQLCTSRHLRWTWSKQKQKA